MLRACASPNRESITAAYVAAGGLERCCSPPALPASWHPPQALPASWRRLPRIVLATPSDPRNLAAPTPSEYDAAELAFKAQRVAGEAQRADNQQRHDERENRRNGRPAPLPATRQRGLVEGASAVRLREVLFAAAHAKPKTAQTNRYVLVRSESFVRFSPVSGA